MKFREEIIDEEDEDLSVARLDTSKGDLGTVATSARGSKGTKPNLL